MAFTALAPGSGGHRTCHLVHRLDEVALPLSVVVADSLGCSSDVTSREVPECFADR